MKRWPLGLGAIAAIATVVVTALVGSDVLASDTRETASPPDRPGQQAEPTALTIEVLLEDSVPHATANVRVADLMGDGSPQMLVTEPFRSQIVWMRGGGDPFVFKAGVEITNGLVQPVRTHVVDMDGDGDRDIVVADIGSLLPSIDPVGRVVLLRNNGAFEFEPIVLLEDVGRVACAEAADLDGDGDLDIAVCVFGHIHGKLTWLEQKEGFVFEEHVLDPRSGAIHAFPFDADGDADLDLAVSLSQDFEEILLFRNDGSGAFSREVLFAAGVDYYGMSGLELSDLDRDGDVDILFTNGDEFEGTLPKELDADLVHGLAWLENDGAGRFTHHEIIRQWASYAVRAADLDGDLDLDIVLSTVQLPDKHPDIAVMDLVWLENDGAQNFTRHEIEGAPPMMATIDVIDVDKDGVPEIVGGSLDLPCSVNAFRTGDIRDSPDWDGNQLTCTLVGHRLSKMNLSIERKPSPLPSPADTDTPAPLPELGEALIPVTAWAAAAAGALLLILGLAFVTFRGRGDGTAGRGE